MGRVGRPCPQTWPSARCRGSEARAWLTAGPGLPQLIEDLRKQLEHLQLFKLEAEQRRGRSSSVGLQEYHSRTRESELEQEVRRLKQVRLAHAGAASVGHGRMGPQPGSDGRVTPLRITAA